MRAIRKTVATNVYVFDVAREMQSRCCLRVGASSRSLQRTQRICCVITLGVDLSWNECIQKLTFTLKACCILHGYADLQLKALTRFG